MARRCGGRLTNLSVTAPDRLNRRGWVSSRHASVERTRRRRQRQTLTGVRGQGTTSKGVRRCLRKASGNDSERRQRASLKGVRCIRKASVDNRQASENIFERPYSGRLDRLRCGYKIQTLLGVGFGTRKKNSVVAGFDSLKEGGEVGTL